MMKRHLLWPLLLTAACAKDNTDAWGSFEAVETRVATELPGHLIRFDVTEGGPVSAGSVVAQLDTVALVLQRNSIIAKQVSVHSRTNEIDANIASIDAQLVIAQRELDRMNRLKASEAATAQQVDAAQKPVTTLTHQIDVLQASRGEVDKDAQATSSTVAELDDKIRRGRVVSPISGTVLTKFVQEGEMVQAGAPLFSVASLDTLTFRAYLGGDQLNQVHVGSDVFVRVDAGGGTLKTFPGRVTWIASTAEFTPTPIQTRKERTTQVYAVKIAVANPDKTLRIGMPGELRFTADSTTK